MGKETALLPTRAGPRGRPQIFNNPVRIAWWEGPPFGGGQWHAECRGDAKAFNAVLADFAKVDVKTKRLVVHDGVGVASGSIPISDPAKQAAARVDWVFMVWQPASWDHLRKSPADLNPTDARDADKGPPSQIDVYTGGNLRWSDVTVPEGLEVVDERLEAHGFTLADGIVLEGKVIDLATKQPIAARMRLQRVEPQPKGEYHYTVVSEAAADTQGRWVLKKRRRLASRGRGGGRLCVEGCRLRSVRRTARLALLRLRIVPPARPCRVALPMMRASRWRT